MSGRHRLGGSKRLDPGKELSFPILSMNLLALPASAEIRIVSMVSSWILWTVLGKGPGHPCRPSVSLTPPICRGPGATCPVAGHRGPAVGRMTRLAAPRRARRGGPGCRPSREPERASATPAPSVRRLNREAAPRSRGGSRPALVFRSHAKTFSSLSSEGARPVPAISGTGGSSTPAIFDTGQRFARSPGSSRNGRPRARTALAALALRTASRRAGQPS